MKTVYKKNAAILLLLAFCCFSCSNEMENGNENNEFIFEKDESGNEYHASDIYIVDNQWKLVRASIGSTYFDYSQYEIIYEFRKNNILKVKGDTDNIENYVGHDIGDHFLKFRTIDIIKEHQKKPDPLILYNPFSMLIDDLGYPYTLFPEDQSNPKELNVLILNHWDNSNGSIYDYKLIKIK